MAHVADALCVIDMKKEEVCKGCNICKTKQVLKAKLTSGKIDDEYIKNLLDNLRIVSEEIERNNNINRFVRALYGLPDPNEVTDVPPAWKAAKAARRPGKSGLTRVLADPILKVGEDL